MATRKKKPDDSSYQELKRDIDSGNIGNLYLFHGEEVYLRNYYLKLMKENLLTGGIDDFNYHTIPAKDFSVDLLRELVDAMPMMSERTMVVVSDYDIYKGGSRDAMIDLLSDLPDYVCLIFVYDVIEYKVDHRAKLAKLVKEKGKAVDFVRQDQENLVRWIARHFRALGHEISSDDARYLIFLCGDLMTGLASEIEKVGAYAREYRVTRQDINTVATPQLSAVVFQLTDALTAREFDKTFAVLGDLYHMQQPPIMLLAVLGKQLRQLYSAKLALENGKGKDFVMELWGLHGPGGSFAADKLIRSARKAPLRWWRWAVIRCQEVDLAMKSTGRDAEELFTGLLLELTTTAGRI